MQLISDIAATASPYVPAGQFVQPVEPAALHVPGLQLEQEPTNVAPVVALYVPAVQLVHGAVPSTLYVPAGQWGSQLPVTVFKLVLAAHICSYAVSEVVIGITLGP